MYYWSLSRTGKEKQHKDYSSFPSSATNIVFWFLSWLIKERFSSSLHFHQYVGKKEEKIGTINKVIFMAYLEKKVWDTPLLISASLVRTESYKALPAHIILGVEKDREWHVHHWKMNLNLKTLTNQDPIHTQFKMLFLIMFKWKNVKKIHKQCFPIFPTVRELTLFI